MRKFREIGLSENSGDSFLEHFQTLFVDFFYVSSQCGIWNLQNFSVTQFLREIKVGEFRVYQNPQF